MICSGPWCFPLGWDYRGPERGMPCPRLERGLSVGNARAVYSFRRFDLWAWAWPSRHLPVKFGSSGLVDAAPWGASFHHCVVTLRSTAVQCQVAAAVVRGRIRLFAPALRCRFFVLAIMSRTRRATQVSCCVVQSHQGYKMRFWPSQARMCAVASRRVAQRRSAFRLCVCVLVHKT